MNANKTDDELVTAIGVFPGYAEAGRAVEALRAAGFRDDHIGVVGPHDRDRLPERSGLPNDPTHTQWEEGAEIGAAAGGLAGLGFGAAVVAGLITPIGPVLAGGALAALLAGTASGAAIGAFIGAFAGMGVSEEDARWYASEVQAGRVVVTVRGSNGTAAQDILDRQGAVNRPATNPQ